jgi:hypothetical protein
MPDNNYGFYDTTARPNPRWQTDRHPIPSMEALIRPASQLLVGQDVGTKQMNDWIWLVPCGGIAIVAVPPEVSKCGSSIATAHFRGPIAELWSRRRWAVLHTRWKLKAEALTLLRAGSYDLMLRDVWMPKMNGLDVLAALPKEGRHLN